MVNVIACGALANDLIDLDRERGWGIRVLPLPPLLHNHPDRIAGQVEEVLDRLELRDGPVLIAYSDCGTYGALDEVCERRGVIRLPGAHCYDVYAGSGGIEQILADEPGTYLLTDFLVRGFHRTVIVELGLDRYPELRADYFGNYSRVVWLATRSEDRELAALAEQAAAALGLPLEVRAVGRNRLADAVESLLAT
jgi:hypothetical protein